MTLQEILTAISTVGFPIAVALWFMIVDHKDSKANTEAINKMANVVENNTKLVEKLHDK